MKMFFKYLLIISFSNKPHYLPNNLRVLEWTEYPSQSFPSNFYPKKIRSSDLFGGPLHILEKPFIERFEHLIYMNISYCLMVTEFPDVFGAVNLRELRLDGCMELVTIHKLVGGLPNLIFLSASECYQLRSFVPTIYLPSLEYLSFNDCIKLTLPKDKGNDG
ncbi:hypothetical protein JHK86_009899 [Glycine max]|nr:hypothetical protein JHK86_009899 [Glycine max]